MKQRKKQILSIIYFQWECKKFHTSYVSENNLWRFCSILEHDIDAKSVRYKSISSETSNSSVHISPNISPILPFSQGPTKISEGYSDGKQCMFSSQI